MPAPRLTVAAAHQGGPRPTPAAWRQAATTRGVRPPTTGPVERASTALSTAPPALTAAAAAVGAWLAMSLLNRLTGRG